MTHDWDEVTDRVLAGLVQSRRKPTEQKTEGEVFDEPTIMALYRLINQGLFARLEYPVSTGKEANVYLASSDAGPLAVKIYRVYTSTFNQHLEYIQGDPRFGRMKPGKRGVVEMWAHKEFRNLSEMRDAGLPVPPPVHVFKNIVVMRFIGNEHGPAPLLKEIRVEEADEIVGRMRSWIVELYRKARLVHGDLSEFNVLVHDGELVLIDCAQAVSIKHPRAREYLERDIHNVARYAKRLGVTVDEAKVLEECLTAPGGT